MEIVKEVLTKALNQLQYEIEEQDRFRQSHLRSAESNAAQIKRLEKQRVELYNALRLIDGN